MSKIDFTDRVAIVTGAGGGLGRSHAQLIAERGGKVVVNDIKGAAQAVEEIAGAGFEAIVSEHDISKAGEAAALVAATIEAYGKVDALINNAMAMRFTSPAEATPEEY